MNKVIGYIHFIGFIPAMVTYLNERPDAELGWNEVILSAIFSWGFVIGDFLSR